MGIAGIGVRTLVAGAAIATAPLIVAAPAHADPIDDLFIQTLDSSEVPYKSREDAIRNAKKICTLLGEAPGEEGLQDAVAYLKKFTTYSQEQMGQFGGAAIGAYCPENNPNSQPAE
jgi:Protein of unknown function (DUF732)